MIHPHRAVWYRHSKEKGTFPEMYGYMKDPRWGTTEIECCHLRREIGYMCMCLCADTDIYIWTHIATLTKKIKHTYIYILVMHTNVL